MIATIYMSANFNKCHRVTLVHFDATSALLHTRNTENKGHAVSN